MNLPDVRGREQILQVHARKVKMAPGVSFERIARGTSGFSGAQLDNLVNEACLLYTSHARVEASMEGDGVPEGMGNLVFDFRMQHVFLSFFPAGPEGVLSLESGIQLSLIHISGSAASRPLRPAGGGEPAGRPGARTDPAGASQKSEDGARSQL